MTLFSLFFFSFFFLNLLCLPFCRFETYPCPFTIQILLNAMASPSESKGRPALQKDKNPIVTTYLVAYNVAQVLGYELFAHWLNLTHCRPLLPRHWMMTTYCTSLLPVFFCCFYGQFIRNCAPQWNLFDDIAQESEMFINKKKPHSL